MGDIPGSKCTVVSNSVRGLGVRATERLYMAGARRCRFKASPSVKYEMEMTFINRNEMYIK